MEVAGGIGGVREGLPPEGLRRRRGNVGPGKGRLGRHQLLPPVTMRVREAPECGHELELRVDLAVCLEPGAGCSDVVVFSLELVEDGPRVRAAPRLGKAEVVVGVAPAE